MTLFNLEDKKILVAGSRGMAGSAIKEELLVHELNVIPFDERVDYRNQKQAFEAINFTRPDVLIIAAAKVGGIQANKTRKGEFIYDNLMIQTNLLEAARVHNVRKVLFLGSSCIYPRNAPNPIKETSLLTGPLESSNDAYAVAKIAGIQMCQAYREQYGCDFISCMPCNLYGPGDRYDDQAGHVLASLLNRFHESKKMGASHISIWGTGVPKREFMHVHDFARGVYVLLTQYSGYDPINIGTGEEVTIAELADMISDTVGYDGKIVYDRTMPDGVPQKLIDSSRIRQLGWKPQIDLRTGLSMTYEAFKRRPVVI